MSDLGVPADFLGIEIDFKSASETGTGRATCRLHQTRYTQEILKKFGMEDC